jgi:hypothetical protein
MEMRYMPSQAAKEGFDEYVSEIKGVVPLREIAQATNREDNLHPVYVKSSSPFTEHSSLDEGFMMLRKELKIQMPSNVYCYLPSPCGNRGCSLCFYHYPYEEEEEVTTQQQKKSEEKKKDSRYCIELLLTIYIPPLPYYYCAGNADPLRVLFVCLLPSSSLLIPFLVRVLFYFYRDLSKGFWQVFLIVVF